MREAAEHELGRIPGAKLLPLGEVALALGLGPDLFEHRYGFPKPDPTHRLIFHCRSGKHSGQACDVARGLGYSNVANYEGSWLDWEARCQA